VLPEPNFPARPEEFVGRKPQVEAFEQVLVQGLLTGRTASFAVLGDWGVGKSSLLLKYSAISSGPDYAHAAGILFPSRQNSLTTNTSRKACSTRSPAHWKAPTR